MRDATWLAVSLILWCGCSDLAGDDGDAGVDPGGDAGGNGDGGGGGDGGGDAGPPGRGLSIAFDYRYDDAGFFTPARRAVLEAAARPWHDALGDDFAEIPAGTSVRTRDPEAPGAAGMAFDIEVPIDDVLVFVGCSAIDGPGGTLAISNHAAAINSVTDPTLREQLRARYESAHFEPWTGWISFDCGENWFFDPTPATLDDLPSSQPDFLSTASHELGHVLGFGTALAFATWVSGATLTGPAVVAAYGGPVPMQANGIHFASGLTSDGREPLMDPSRPGGVRSSPTAIDLGAILDLGYEPR